MDKAKSEFTVTRVRIREWLLEAWTKHASDTGYSKAGVLERALVAHLRKRGIPCER